MVHIDRLVLHGVDPRDRRAMAAALQQALSETLAQQPDLGPLAGRGHVADLKVPPIQVEAGAAPAGLGAAIGRGIGKELGQ